MDKREFESTRRTFLILHNHIIIIFIFIFIFIIIIIIIIILRRCVEIFTGGHRVTGGHSVEIYKTNSITFQFYVRGDGQALCPLGIIIIMLFIMIYERLSNTKSQLSHKN